MGLNMYDVMALAAAARDEPTTEWSPERHRMIDGRGGASSCCPRSPRASPTAAYLFYDCQTDDVRLVLTVLGEAERFGAVLRQRRAR